LCALERRDGCIRTSNRSDCYQSTQIELYGHSNNLREAPDIGRSFTKKVDRSNKA